MQSVRLTMPCIAMALLVGVSHPKPLAASAAYEYSEASEVSSSGVMSVRSVTSEHPFVGYTSVTVVRNEMASNIEEVQISNLSLDADLQQKPLAMDLNCRFGITAPLGLGGYKRFLVDLDVCAYLNWSDSRPSGLPSDIEFLHVLRADTARLPDQATLSSLLATYPGAVWEFGNEPDTCVGPQDCTTAEVYAERFFAVASQIRAEDPTAKIGFGTIVQPTPVRLHYLTLAWNRLVQLAGSQAAASALIDVWTIHAFIICEDGDWGTERPPGYGSGWPAPECPSVADTHSVPEFRKRIREMRKWMKQVGERNKPLWITEYGSIFPPVDPPGSQNYALVSDAATAAFMTGTFDYLTTATDATLGYPADGNRLVQRWYWYSLNEHRHRYGGALYDPDKNRARTEVGTAWINYVNPGVFTDVLDDWEKRAHVEALYNAGYVAGCSSTPRMYCPGNTLNRAESAVFVIRGNEGGGYTPPPPVGPSQFVDVPNGIWYHKWVEDMLTKGFTSGCATNPLKYCPDTQHSRVEATVFFLRIKYGGGYVPPNPAGPPTFADVSDPSWWGYKWVEKAYADGLLPACQTTPQLKFCPNSPLTRAWAAYMMVKAKGLPIQ